MYDLSLAYLYQSDVDLTSWLRSFERCCIIASKAEDLVKGQVLMLCLAGQALAVAEIFEEDLATPKSYSEIVTTLRSVFESAADRENKQILFDKRIQQIHESEEEFMFELIKLHRAANPNATANELCLNVKRRFLSGISADLRRNIF